MLKLKNEFEQKLGHLIYEWPEAFACFSLLQDLRRHVDDSVDFWVSNKLRSHVHVMHLSSYHKKMNGKLSTTDRARVSNGTLIETKVSNIQKYQNEYFDSCCWVSPFFFLRCRSHEWLSLENLVSFAILSRCHSLLPFIMGYISFCRVCSSGLHCFLFFAPFISIDLPSPPSSTSKQSAYFLVFFIVYRETWNLNAALQNFYYQMKGKMRENQ